MVLSRDSSIKPSFRGRVRSVLARLCELFRLRRLDADFNEEVRFHLTLETEYNLSRGMPPEAARRAAFLAFGGVERAREEVRDARGVRPLETFIRDTRHAMRGLRRSPGFATAVVVTLALGTGATAGVFNVVDRLLFRPPAYLLDPRSVNRVYLEFDSHAGPVVGEGLEYRRYLDLVQFTSSFSQAAAFAVAPLAVGARQDVSELQIGRISASFFSFFEAQPVIGRFFGARDDIPPAGAPVAVLSYEAWQQHYAGTLDVLGKQIMISSGTFTVIGVAPRGFTGVDEGAPPFAWIPATAFAALGHRDYSTQYNWGWLSMIVRRKPGVQASVAMADMTTAYRRSWQAERMIDPSVVALESARPHVVLAPPQVFRGPTAGPAARITLWIGALALIALFVACANVGSLLLARALRRRRETAVRLAIGASRTQLVSQALAEGVVFAVLGIAAGLVLAQVLARSLTVMVGVLDAAPTIVTDVRTIAFCAGVTIVVALFASVTSASHVEGGSLDVVMRASARAGAYQKSRTRVALVLSQTALSTLLLIVAGLFQRSVGHVHQMHLGYDVDPILVVQRNLRGRDMSDGDLRDLMALLEERARSVVGVIDATRMISTPFYSHESTPLYVSGIDSVSKLGRFQMQFATPAYFRTIGTRILAGREFTSADGTGAPLVIIVSREMARRLWPRRTALGQCVRFQPETDAPCRTVVGIAEDIKERELSHTSEANFYVPVGQLKRAPVGLYVRVRGNAADHADEVRRALQAVMPGDTYVSVTPLTTIVGDATRSWQVGARAFTALAVLALTLAVIGLYGLISYTVSERSQEIGVRIALGARRKDIMTLVLAQGVRLGVAGTALGACLAAAAGGWLAPILFDESPRDPLVLGSVTAVLAAVSVGAALMPALRGARLDPNIALRTD